MNLSKQIDDCLGEFDTWCMCGKPECALAENFKNAHTALLKAFHTEMMRVIGEDELVVDTNAKIHESSILLEESRIINKFKATQRKRIDLIMSKVGEDK